MGLMQRAYETYCAMEKTRAGRYFADEKEPLAPVSHKLVKAELEITLDDRGHFVNAVSVDKNEPRTIIPVTERSAGRTSTTIAPHPLSDQLCYLAPDYPQKHKEYLEQLRRWEGSAHTHPKLTAVLRYIEGGTILEDLRHFRLIKVDEHGAPKKGEESLVVRWRVLSEGDEDACWKDIRLFQSFIDFYGAAQERDTVYCMISGIEDGAALQHPKGVVPSDSNAKLVSANDESGFTYRGRFQDKDQAVTISYQVSQKAHNALRWLAVNQGVSRIGGADLGRTFLCWNPQGAKLPSFILPGLEMPEENRTPTQYQQQLRNTLKGWQDSLPSDATAVITAFDAATSGRLSLTYYNELQGSDFLNRLHQWDRICCWYHGPFGVQSPSLYQIVNSAFGVPRISKGKAVLETDERVLGQQIQRLLSCRIDGQQIPSDIIHGLMNRCANLQILDRYLRDSLLFTACAVVRKYHYDRYKEEWKMALEPEKHDLSYQFGRLLAVLEIIERRTYDQNEGREPNAMRMQAAFSQRPFHVGRLILDQVKKAYYPQLKPGSRVFYERLVGQIMEQISRFPEHEWNRPLGDTYLFGYYLQKNELDSRGMQQKEMEE